MAVAVEAKVEVEVAVAVAVAVVEVEVHVPHEVGQLSRIDSQVSQYAAAVTHQLGSTPHADRNGTVEPSAVFCSAVDW